MENNFSSYINQANSVLILLAKNPYVDQVASALSLYLALKEGQGKNVTVASSSEMMVEHNRLVGVDKITTKPGNKNLVIRFSNYQADNIERVSYDVEGQEFRLSVIPKPQFEAPTKEQIDLSYSGIAADLVILVGGMNESHFPMLTSGQLAESKLVHIGVQPLTVNENYQIQSFAEGTASTSELTYQLIQQVGANITADISTNLLMGMQEGTRSFTHSRVTAQTFKTAAELMEKGGNLDPTQNEQQKQYQPGSIPGTVAQSPAQQQQVQPTPAPKAPQSWIQPKIYKGSSEN